jgi:hypothetical protein
MSFDAAAVRKELEDSGNSLVWEVETLWKLLKENDFYGDTRHWPMAHYAFMMACFARIDLLSRYWEGTNADQTLRMRRFMLKYMYPGKDKEVAIAIKLWRHGLMHTAEPRMILISNTETKVANLLHFGDWLPKEQHFTLIQGAYEVLNMAVTFFAADVRDALGRYLDDLEDSEDLQAKYLSSTFPN